VDAEPSKPARHGELIALERALDDLQKEDPRAARIVDCRFFGGMTIREAPPSLVGREIGPWRVTQAMASGGMGDVYLAERADGLYEREVALKVLRPGRRGEESQERPVRSATARSLRQKPPST